MSPHHHKSDEQIERDVMDALDDDPAVDETNIVVTAQRGRVLLTGTVPSYSDLAAGYDARRIVGVTSVDNQLIVVLPSDRVRADDAIAGAAIDALLWNDDIPNGIAATVADGVVTLRGRVDHHYQRIAAEESVRSLVGVRGVVDEIAIKPSPMAADVSTRIQNALLRSAAFDASRVSVSTEDGTVVLRGTVSSLAERDQAEAAAWSNPGVAEVDNELTIGD